jgi:hypothetical protein
MSTRRRSTSTSCFSPNDGAGVSVTALWEAFVQYLAARAPSDWERSEVRRYRQRIHDALDAEFRLMSFYQSGSFQHGTAVTPWSDVDYIARIWFEDRPISSTSVLNQMRELLGAEFAGEVWDLHVDRPAVTLRFNALVTDYEITPAYLLRGSTDGDRVVLIPALGGQWREAAPKAHHMFVAETDQKHNGGVRELARLLKAWKYEHSVPISSFYLEMRCAEYGKNTDSIWTLSALRRIADDLVQAGLAAMNDPTRLVSRITACSSEPNRLSSMTQLGTLKRHLDDAFERYFAAAGMRRELNQSLQAVWGSDFPYCDPYEGQMG